MPLERHALRYARLFEVRVLHHYWLDEGATLFDALSAETRAERLRGYDVRRLLEITPTRATTARLAGLQAVCRATSLGLVVGLPDNVGVAPADGFEFTLRIVDPDFLAYTAYGLTMPRTAEVQQISKRRAFRYRTDAALYSNLTGCARTLGGGKQTFLTREAPARQAGDRIESIVNQGGALVQLLSDLPATPPAELGLSAASLPAFATHADVPQITALAPPSDIVGTTPARGILLPDGAPFDTYALLRVAAVRPGEPDFSCTGAGGLAKAHAPVFELRFKSRRTLWRRHQRSSPETVLSQTGPHPLTHHGNPSTGQKPASRAVKLERSGSAITNIVSEIYT